MKVLLVTQYFFPENFKSNDIAFELSKKGYNVDVLCGIPNYPQGKYYKGYNLFKRRIERINGVNIYRVFQTPRGNNNFSLALNYLSFVISGCIWVLFFFLYKKYDSVIVHATSPITQSIPAVFLCKIKKIPLYLWVLDLWPDALRSGGGFKDGIFLNLINKLVIYIYENSNKILISSKGFMESICEKKDFKDKIIYFPNWSEDVFLANEEYQVPKLPEGFKIILAGNLGKSQNLDSIMAAALLTKNDLNIKWILIGDGSKKMWLDDFILKHDLSNTVYALGRYPLEAMPAFYKQANAMLVSLRSDFPHLKLVVPARLQSYMAAGRPILGLIEGGGAEIIRDSNCGYVVDSTDYKSLVDIIYEKVLVNLTEFEKKGRNGREYFMKNFSKEKCIDSLISIFHNCYSQ